MTETNFKNVTTSWIVSWEFSVISEGSCFWGQLYLKVAVHNIATPNIFRIILFALFISQEIELFALGSWKLLDFRKLLTKKMLTFEGFVEGS